jgi:hypothetical protein
MSIEFAAFQQRLRSTLLSTATDGDCFFDTLAQITGLSTAQGTAQDWRRILAQRLYENGTFTLPQNGKVWADFPVVFEAVRLLNRPMCVVQYESPNAVTLIRPEKVAWTSALLYVVYVHGSHFTSFRDPLTPNAWIERLNAFTGLQEEVPGLVVIHGMLHDLFPNQACMRNKERTKSQTKNRSKTHRPRTRKTLVFT